MVLRLHSSDEPVIICRQINLETVFEFSSIFHFSLFVSDGLHLAETGPVSGPVVYDYWIVFNNLCDYQSYGHFLRNQTYLMFAPRISR
jgi:hypothetical protein